MGCMDVVFETGYDIEYLSDKRKRTAESWILMCFYCLKLLKWAYNSLKLGQKYSKLVIVITVR